MNTRLASLAALLASSLLTAQAATSTTDYLLAEDLTDWRSFLDLQQFNPTLGTLDSVTVELTATLSGSGGVENKQTSRGHTFVVRLDGSLLLDLPSAGAALAFNRSLVNQTVALAKFDNAIDLAGTSGMNWTYTVQGNTSRSFNDAPQLAAFTGTGTLGAAVSADAVYLIDGPTNRYANFDTAVSSRITVRYDYTVPSVNAAVTAVPEPGTWLLMLAGLGAIGLLSARRRT